MDNRESCNNCPNQFLCHCLRLTASAIRQALGQEKPKCLEEVIQQSGAGSGCTACRRKLNEFVA
jgi:bacterioferritin-associated ferredoxin